MDLYNTVLLHCHIVIWNNTFLMTKNLHVKYPPAFTMGAHRKFIKGKLNKIKHQNVHYK